MTENTKFYLFEMYNGKQKLAYGKTPEEAIEILALRLTPKELALINTKLYKKVSQKDLQNVKDNLG